MYEKSLQPMNAYVTRKYDNSDNIKMILNELKIPTLEKPNALDSTEDYLDKDIYKEDIK